MKFVLSYYIKITYSKTYVCLTNSEMASSTDLQDLNSSEHPPQKEQTEEEANNSNHDFNCKKRRIEHRELCEISRKKVKIKIKAQVITLM